MKQYDSVYDIDKTIMEYCGKDAVFLDIETTGLKKETSLIYLVACGYYSDGKLQIHQWFNDDAISEEAILLALISFLAGHKDASIITFNGENFDLPFLKAHFAYNELPCDIFSSIVSVDLYRLLRGFVPLYGLENGSQKSWERFLGLLREDIYDGGKLIPVYKKYLKNKNSDLLHIILLHNLEDIKGLAALMPLLSLQQIHKTTFDMHSLEESVWKEKPVLTFHLIYKKDFPKSLSITSSLGVFKISGKDATLSIPFQEGKMYHFYSDYKNYYYLPLEDRAIHKNIGCYVDKEHREKATKRNCYSPLDSIFFPIPKKTAAFGFSIDPENQINCSLYQTDATSKEQFLSYEDLFENDCVTQKTKQYLCMMIQAILLEWIRSLS